jgi:hypothetical protein
MDRQVRQAVQCEEHALERLHWPTACRQTGTALPLRQDRFGYCLLLVCSVVVAG